MPSPSETMATAVTKGALNSVRKAKVRLRIKALDERGCRGVYVRRPRGSRAALQPPPARDPSAPAWRRYPARVGPPGGSPPEASDSDVARGPVESRPRHR